MGCANTSFSPTRPRLEPRSAARAREQRDRVTALATNRVPSGTIRTGPPRFSRAGATSDAEALARRRPGLLRAQVTGRVWASRWGRSDRGNP